MRVATGIILLCYMTYSCSAWGRRKKVTPIIQNMIDLTGFVTKYGNCGWNDISNRRNINDLEVCADECKQNTACVGFIVGKTSPYRCWFKNKCGRLNNDRNAVFYEKQREPEAPCCAGYEKKYGNCNRNDIKNIQNVWELNDCRAECDKDHTCVGFIAQPARPYRCWLKRTCDRRNTDKTAIYWEKGAQCGTMASCPANAYCDRSLEQCECKRGFSPSEDFSACEPSCSCQASGDPHYKTYDGSKINFYGSCKYTLSKFTGHGECAFNIEVKNEYRGWNRRVSYTRLVDVKFGGKRYRLHQGSNLYIGDSNSASALPYKASKVAVVLEGRKIVFMSEPCGVRVSFDGKSFVEVEVPSRYANKMIGICGNCNGDRGDDLTTLEGEYVGGRRNGQSLVGASFSVGDDSDRPSKHCKVVPPVDITIQCDADRLRDVDQPHVCGYFKDSRGPFGACIKSGKVDNDALYLSCKTDVCAFHKDEEKKVACDMLAAFSDQCIKFGFYPNWRSPSVCPLWCPSNSEYNHQMKACPNNCKAKTAESMCQAPDVEGCACKRGFILDNWSGSRCIKESDCGSPPPPPPTQVVYTPPPPTTPQRAPVSGGDCGGCPANAYCDRTIGQCVCKRRFALNAEGSACEPACSCYARGDVHYQSYDGLKFNFHGICKYTLTKSTTDDECAFNVEIKNEHRGWNRRVSWTRLVDVKFGGKRLRLHQGDNLFIGDDKSATYLPYSGADRSYEVMREGGNIVFLAAKCGIRVSFNGKSNVEVEVPRRYSNKMNGLCGNCDRDRGNDFTTLEGEDVGRRRNKQELFGASFSVPDDSDRPSINCKKVPDVDPEIKCEANRLMGINKSHVCGFFKKGPFEDCIKSGKIDVDTLYKDCKTDVCAYPREQESKIVCGMLAAFADKCIAFDFYPDWRTDTFCPLHCPADSKYSHRMTDCQNSCTNEMAESLCEAPDVEGCQCEDGFLLGTANRCLKKEDCQIAVPPAPTQVVYTPPPPPTSPPAFVVHTSKGPCVFPFTYKKKRYDNCVISSTRPWCAISAHYSTDKKWGYCKDPPIDPQSCRNVLPDNACGLMKPECLRPCIKSLCAKTCNFGCSSSCVDSAKKEICGLLRNQLTCTNPLMSTLCRKSCDYCT